MIRACSQEVISRPLTRLVKCWMQRRTSSRQLALMLATAVDLRSALLANFWRRRAQQDWPSVRSFRFKLTNHPNAAPRGVRSPGVPCYLNFFRGKDYPHLPKLGAYRRFFFALYQKYLAPGIGESA
jgi:hypothetical protein